MKHDALSLRIVVRDPKGHISCSSTKDSTISEEGLNVGQSIGKIVRCSTQIKMYLTEISAEADVEINKGPAQ